MNHLKIASRSAIAIGIATALTLASGVACASPVIVAPTIFLGQNNSAYIAAIDPVTGLGWVTPNIAENYIYGNLETLCSGAGGACSGPLAGLNWATSAQVDTFWGDAGVPLNDILGITVPGSEEYSAVGQNRLGYLIGLLGPTDVTGGYTLGTGGKSYYLGGITNDGLTAGLPRTAYMFHDYTKVAGYDTPALDNESAITYGTGNGVAELPSTGGWFYFTPSTGGSTSVPEPGSLGMLGLGLGLLGLGLIWDKRRRDKRELKAGVPMSGSFA